LAGSERWEGLQHRTLTAPWRAALDLFSFAGAWAPPAGDIDSSWGAWHEDRLVAALLLERAPGGAMVYGPVAVAPAGTPPDAVLDVMARVVGDCLAAVPGRRVTTIYARPQGLDRVWVRTGFIPLPESELPPGLRGRPGSGLYGWRGGSALWTSTGRDVERAGRRRPR
jgi:hypothetical protein